MQGGVGWNLSILGVDPDPCGVLSDVPVSRNWYKTVSNVRKSIYNFFYKNSGS